MTFRAHLGILVLVVLAGCAPSRPQVTPRPASEPLAEFVVTAPATTTTVPATSTTSRVLLEVATPITARLPYQDPHFSIDYRLEGEQVRLVVTLKVVLNRPEQLAQARVALATYRAEVLAFLAAHGVGSSTYPIEWHPATL